MDYALTCTNVEDEDDMNAARDLSVTVKRAEVLARVQENRSNHEAAYREALSGWLDSLTEKVDAIRKSLRQTVVEDLTEANVRSFAAKWALNTAPPQNYLREYDQVIGTLSMCVQDELELTGEQINAWCYDRWDWADQFANSTVAYVKMKKR